MRRRPLVPLFLLICAISCPMHSQMQQKTESGHYLLAWTGDTANKRAGCSANCGAERREGWGNDHLAVIDADPSFDCPRYQEWSEASGGLTLEHQRNV